MSAFHDNALIGASGQGGYFIDRSVRLRSSASAYLSRTPASTSNQKTWTFSCWMKRGTLGTNGMSLISAGTASNNGTSFYFSSDQLIINNIVSGGSQGAASTPAVLRDPSAWYHIVLSMDTTQTSFANGWAKIFINGVQQTLTQAAAPTQNSNTFMNLSTNAMWIARDIINANYFDGYLTEVNFVDGQALTPSDFGETDVITGVWKPKKYVGTYGTNGFYLNFSDNTSTTTLGYDYSGNGNNWTANNISLTSGVTYDSMTDVPTLTSETAGNYCTLNPLAVVTNQTGTYSDGNLTYTSPSSTYGSCASTMAIPSSGKWYAEVTPTSAATYWWFIGLCEYSANGGPLYSNTNAVSYYSGNGNKYVDNVASSYGSSYTTNDVIGIAVDADSNTVTFYKNNVSQGSISHSVAGLFFSQGDASTGGSTSAAWNFGQRPFAYTPPTGFKALNTFNLPDSTIVDGSQYFDATTYTGTGATQSIVNSDGMQPDFVWLKNRSYGPGASHRLFDSARGTNALYSNLTNAEANESAYFSSLNSNGFTVTANDQATNFSGSAYIAWQWKAGGSAVNNTDGSITSQVSANTTSGFSVVTCTTPASGAFTIGHGLGVAPSMYIVKRRSVTSSWGVWHQGLSGGTYFALLESTSAQVNDATVFTASPTSTVLNIGSAWTAYGAQTMVAYCFAEVPGFSKFGKYTGNGSADGPFVFCGFRPKFVLVKNASTGGAGYDWYLWDSARQTYNVIGNSLAADLSGAEFSATNLDFTSNGFKLRTSSSAVNNSGNTIIYAAFAENPFKNSLAR